VLSSRHDPHVASMNAPSEVEREVQRIAALLGARRYEEAAAGAAALRTRVPQNRDVLFLLASAQRLAGQVPAALETLATLEQLHPRYSRLFQERGHCFVLLKQAPEAIEAFLAAVNMNVALPAL
jgi:tetratricopeptide (TPR) repeat protein